MLVPRLCSGPVVLFGFPVPDRQLFNSKIITKVIVTRYIALPIKVFDSYKYRIYAYGKTLAEC
ncbi:MAG: hypothetical protein F6J93_28345 [Oscillatoria sp. SIO1A7]|nr:hypothetical protein [Oscillatoria sp. SIO1A7]